MRTLNTILSSLYRVFAVFNGSMSIKKVFNYSKSIGSLHVKVFDDFEIDVFCYKREYIVSRENALFGDSTKTVYDISCKVRGESPELLSRVCASVITLPPLAPSFMDEEYHLKLLVNAYLDIIRQDLLDQLGE